MRLAAKAGIPLLKKALTEEGKQTGAAYLLGFLGSDGAAILIAAWKDATPRVRTAILENLANMGVDARAAIPILPRLVLDGNPPGNVYCILEGIGFEALPALVALMKEAGASERRMVIELFGRIGPRAKEAIPLLAAALAEPDLADAAGHSLKLIGPESVPAVTKALGDPQRRAAALVALRKFGAVAKDAIPALVQVIKEDERSADVAAYALTNLGVAAMPALLQAMRDPENQRAAAVLGDAGRANSDVSRVAVPELRKLLTDGDAVVRRRAAEALGRIGPSARAALPTLREAGQDADAGVRRTAAQALKTIKGEN